MDYPPIVDAIARFRSFLNNAGFRDPIRWVFPGDARLVGGRWFVRPRAEAETSAEVAADYECATARRFGVKLGVLCHGEGVLWCYIYCPADRAETEQCLMPDGLKLSVRTPPDQGRLVTDEAEWEALEEREQVEFGRLLFM